MGVSTDTLMVEMLGVLWVSRAEEHGVPLGVWVVLLWGRGHPPGRFRDLEDGR